MSIHFQKSVLGATEKLENNQDTDIRNFAKYILKEGTGWRKKRTVRESNLKNNFQRQITNAG